MYYAVEKFVWVDAGSFIFRMALQSTVSNCEGWGLPATGSLQLFNASTVMAEFQCVVNGSCMGTLSLTHEQSEHELVRIQMLLHID